MSGKNTNVPKELQQALMAKKLYVGELSAELYHWWSTVALGGI